MLLIAHAQLLQYLDVDTASADTIPGPDGTWGGDVEMEEDDFEPLPQRR